MSKRHIVGNVTSVDGLKVNVLMLDQTNLETVHFDGEIFEGVTVGSYLAIIRGASKIIARVEKEFLEDVSKKIDSHEYEKYRFERYLELKIIGYITKHKFEFGIKRFPMIFNEVILLTHSEIRTILQKDFSNTDNTIPIGKSLLGNINIEIPWTILFNTHLGIFGNTGSGKSNTLAKIYTELFNLEEHTIAHEFNNKSMFVFIDFNGEYLKNGVLRNTKKQLELKTGKTVGDKLPLAPLTFWDIETLSILYSATEKTQRPFLKKAVEFFLNDEGDILPEKLIYGLGSSFHNIFKQNNNKESLSLLLKSLEILGFKQEVDYYDTNGDLINLEWLSCLWHSKSNTYYCASGYLNETNQDEIKAKREEFETLLKSNLYQRIDSLTITEKLRIAVNCHLIYGLSYGHIQFDYISPLIQRIESRSGFIEKTISVESDLNKWETVNVISLRQCNSEAKKMIPLLIAKQLYENHKFSVADETEISSTVHLIIDEAHNILSSQSTREEETWKDYRLEVFEEIIKEGRKFGFFITLASQRPYDISATIVSQLHNYFIHRLVNEQDLKMIANTISSLDTISRSQIPSLSPGQCILTGTSFEMPILIQVNKLDNELSPTSENADLMKLWTAPYIDETNSK